MDPTYVAIVSLEPGKSWLVTANADGSVPINAKVLAEFIPHTTSEEVLQLIVASINFQARVLLRGEVKP